MISLLLATHKRPELLKKFLNSIINTVNNLSNIELVIGINDGDEANIVVTDFLKSNAINHKLLIFKPPYFLNDKVNCIADNASGDLLFAVANDLEFTTKDWDIKINDIFNSVPKDKIFVAWINDGAGSDKLPRHYIIHKNYKLITGNYSQRCLKHYYSDNWIYDVITNLEDKTRFKYLNDIVCLHHSPVLESNIDKDIVDEIRSEMNYLFPIDNHTYIHTKYYRDYEIQLLNKFIKNNS